MNHPLFYGLVNKKLSKTIGGVGWHLLISTVEGLSVSQLRVTFRRSGVLRNAGPCTPVPRKRLEYERRSLSVFPAEPTPRSQSTPGTDTQPTPTLPNRRFSTWHPFPANHSSSLGPGTQPESGCILLSSSVRTSTNKRREIGKGFWDCFFESQISFLTY